MRYCTNCGSPLAEGAKFCTNCGAKVLSAPAQPQSPPPAQPQTPPAQQSAHSQPKPQEPAGAARKPAAPSVAPIVKDLFASASPGTMMMSSWTVANPVKKAVAAARTVTNAARTVQGKAKDTQSNKRRGGCLRFFVIILIIIAVLLILPVVLDYIGQSDISEKIRIFFEDLVDKAIVNL